MKTFGSLVALGFVIAVAGCDTRGPGTNASEQSGVSVPDVPDPAVVDSSYTRHLIERATKLAEREMARMSAAELIYRNQARFHEPKDKLDVLAPGFGTYIKMYRSFTGFEIKDIYRSESFLHPIAYEIEYRYDLLGTTSRPSVQPDSLQKALADTQFDLLLRNYLTRRYKVNKDGDYIGNLPELPPLVNYYTRARPGEAEFGAAPENRLPPEGIPGGATMTVPPTFQTLPPFPGETFQGVLPQ